ncbi:MAG: hypothetical protein AABY22_26875 [Nanoarchaeota archaeon]
MENKCIIGIPVKNDLESFQYMIRSLEGSTNSYDKIIIIESNSTDGAKEYTDLLYQKNSKIEVQHIDCTSLQAYNKLFHIARQQESDLLITQTDVYFPRLYKRDWLNEMRLIAQDKDIGAITTINGGGISGPDYINGLYWLGGWATYFPFRTIDKIGKYDENFPGGYGVDIDYSYRIYKANLQVTRLDYWVEHHMNNAREHDTSPDSERLKKEASIYFKKKWGFA